MDVTWREGRSGERKEIRMNKYRNKEERKKKYEGINDKGKAIPLQAWTGPEGSRRLRLPDFKTISTPEDIVIR